MTEQRVSKPCEWCGKEFGLHLKPSQLKKQRFCSAKCRSKAEGEKRKLNIVLQCEKCGTSFISPSRGKYRDIQRFCSKSCSAKYIAKLPRNKPARVLKTVTCSHCQKEFETNKFIKKAKNIYCSSRCENEHRHKTASSLTQQPERQKFDITARKSSVDQKLINEILRIYPDYGADETALKLNISRKYVANLVARYHVRLSPEKQSEIYKKYNSSRMANNNPMWNPQTKAKMMATQSPMRKEIIRKGLKTKEEKPRSVINKLEIKYYSILDNLGINYIPQCAVKDKFLVDSKIEGNLIIQVDGEYWHGHKRFEPLTPRQLAQQKRDVAQDKYLVACGYTVIRIWERDIDEDFILAVLQEYSMMSDKFI